MDNVSMITMGIFGFILLIALIAIFKKGKKNVKVDELDETISVETDGEVEIVTETQAEVVIYSKSCHSKKYRAVLKKGRSGSELEDWDYFDEDDFITDIILMDLLFDLFGDNWVGYDGNLILEDEGYYEALEAAEQLEVVAEAEMVAGEEMLSDVAQITSENSGEMSESMDVESSEPDRGESIGTINEIVEQAIIPQEAPVMREAPVYTEPAPTYSEPAQTYSEPTQSSSNYGGGGSSSDYSSDSGSSGGGDCGGSCD